MKENLHNQTAMVLLPGGDEPRAGSTSGRSSLTSSARRRRGRRFVGAQVRFPFRHPSQAMWNLIRTASESTAET